MPDRGSFSWRCAIAALAAAWAAVPAGEARVIYVDAENTSGIEDGSQAHPFNTVQEGIDDASDGDTVEAAAGVYRENVNFRGRSIVVRSANPNDPPVVAATILDGNGSGSVVTLDSGEDANSILTGFTIRNGRADYGAGIYCRGHSSPTIRKNTIEQNSAGWQGGGIFAGPGSSPAILENVIRGNSAGHDWGNEWGWSEGGGVSLCWCLSPVLRGNLIRDNVAGGFTEQCHGHGAGVYCCSDPPVVIECNTIVGNRSVGSAGGGGGLMCEWSGVTVRNCIFRGNTAEAGSQIEAWDANVSISYTAVEGGKRGVGDGEEGEDDEDWSRTFHWGEGNLDVDPLFADPNGGDYHLRSQAGRWDPTANAGQGGWVADGVTSPCIDAADAASAYAKEPAPNGGRANMGAYGNTPQASKSVPPPGIASVQPASGPPATRVRITGAYFGVTPGTVQMTGPNPQVLSWTDTEIRCVVRPGAASGPLVVRRPNGTESSGATFTVTDPNIIYVDDDNTSGIENGTPAHPFRTIRSGIDAATAHDLVLVAVGTYVENVSFEGKAVTVRSGDPNDPAVVGATILDGNRSGSVVRFDHGEGSDSVLAGFSIRNGSGTDNCGAGVYCKDSSPRIEKNLIFGNTAHFYGGGVYCCGGSPTVRGNTIHANAARWFGGGVACWDTTAVVSRNVLRGNSAHWYGGGVFVHGPRTPTLRNNVIHDCDGSEGGGIACVSECSPTVESNTAAGNTAERAGGGVYCGWNCSASVRNSILWSNAAADGNELALTESATAAVSYCDLRGGEAAAHCGIGCSLTWGEGNLDADPRFASTDDFHLRSIGGRYEPSTGLPPEDANAWVWDSRSSPCLDAGEPTCDWSYEPQYNGCQINVGAYGNTEQASRTAYPGDADRDLDVDFFDYLTAKGNFGRTVDVGWAEGDFDSDGDVDFFDYLVAKGNFGWRLSGGEGGAAAPTAPAAAGGGRGLISAGGRQAVGPGSAPGRTPRMEVRIRLDSDLPAGAAGGGPPGAIGATAVVTRDDSRSTEYTYIWTLRAVPGAVWVTHGPRVHLLPPGGWGAAGRPGAIRVDVHGNAEHRGAMARRVIRRRR